MADEDKRTASPQQASQLPYLQREQAANYVQSTYGFPCSRHWLAKLAVSGGGPAFRKAGRYPLYALADLDSWAQNRIGPRVQSTAELLTRRSASMATFDQQIDAACECIVASISTRGFDHG